MSRNLHQFEIWFDAMKQAWRNLAHARFTSGTRTIHELSSDFTACQANAIGFASK